MRLLENQLYIKKSQLPFAGKGLFTKKDIAKGSIIIEYIGTISTWQNIVEEEAKTGEFNGYVYYVNRNHVINARHNTKALARYANDSEGYKKIKCFENNCRFLKEDKRVFIKATRDISAGAELFVNYGKDYWEPLQYNKRLRKMQRK